MKNLIIKFLKRKKFLILIFLIHVIGLFLFYNAKILFNENPIYSCDYPYHAYNCYKTSIFLKSGAAWGYNPFFHAGGPEGLTLDNRLLELLCSFFSLKNQFIVIKIWIFGLLLILPFLIYISSENFGFKKEISKISITVFMIYMYHDNFFNQLIYYGLFNFIFGSILSLFFLSIFYKYFIKNKSKGFILFLLFPLIILIHASVWLMLMIPLILFFLYYWNEIPIKKKIFSIFIIILTFIFIYIWVIQPFIENFHPYLENTATNFQINSLKEVLEDLTYIPVNLMKPNWGIQIIKTSIIFFGFLYLIKNIRRKDKMIKIFLITSLIFIILTYFHNVAGFKFLNQIQPYKYIIPLVIFLILPFSLGIKELTKWRFKNKIVQNRLSIIFGITLILFLTYIQLFQSPKPNIFTEAPLDYLILKDWIINNTYKDSRIIIEMGLFPKQLFETPSYAYGFLSLETEREFIGGPIRVSPIIHNFPKLTSDRLFGHKIESLNDQELKEYIRLYNVGWIIARSRKANLYLYKKYQEGFFSNVTKIKKFRIYETNISRSFLFGGEGKIEANFNEIKIKSLKIYDPNNLILKYHWHPTLKSKNAQLSKVFLLDDPVGFIKIKCEKNCKEIKIYNEYS